ncbi:MULTISPECIES: hypothetical protein [Bacillota]|uniref:hypothetical protein n=1 Tax=Bacillota TaxID=1239 RepID=UPI0039F0CEC3
MDKIVIIDEQTSFREGLRKIIELKFGYPVEIIEKEPSKLTQRDENEPPRLIITQFVDQNIELYINEMKAHGTKVVLLSLETSNIQKYIDLDVFDGFLLKNMPTSQLLGVLQGIIENDEVYVHPSIGYRLLKRIQKNTQNVKTTCI